MMSTCRIRLDSLLDEYYAGDSIRGMVICSVDKSQDIEEVQIHLVGAEHTIWLEREVGRVDPVEYSGDNTILEIEGRMGQGHLRSSDHESNDHEYPFELLLPKCLPGTYLNKYGWIKYTIKATLKTGNTLGCTKEVKIISPINLNEINGLKLEPVYISEEKAICSFLCWNGFISIDVHLDKEAFVLGEVAKVDVHITNEGDFEIVRVNAKILMVVESSVVSPHRKSNRDIVLLTNAFSAEVVPVGRQKRYRFELELPKYAAVPNFTLSKLFSQSCILEVTGLQPSWRGDITVATDIVVGHIPIANVRPSPLSWLRVPSQDEINSPTTSLSALDKSKSPPPIGYKRTSFQSDMPRPSFQNNSLPYPPDTREQRMVSVEGQTSPPYHPKPTPYPPDSPKSRDSHLPQIHGACNNELTTEQNVVLPGRHTPSAYAPTKPYPDNNNFTPYPPEEPKLSSSHIPHIQRASHLSHNEYETPYPSYDRESSLETQRSILLAVAKPTPYRSFLSSSSSAQYPPKSSRPPYPLENNSPCTSGMPQSERSTSVRSCNKQSTPYPSSSSPAPYPSAMPKPDYLYEYRSHSSPYPQDTPKPPYSSEFKNSFLSRRYQVPYPLDEARHPQPIKSQPPYPVAEAGHPQPISKSQPPYPLDEARHPQPINKSQPPYPLDDARHPQPINKPHAPYSTDNETPHSNQRHNTSPPSGRSVAPYPVDTDPSTSLSSRAFPLPPKKLPPRCDSIGFAVPTSTASSTASSSEVHETVPFVPPVPHPTSAHTPSAPPRGNDEDDVEPTTRTPLLVSEGRCEITPPPSYEEAISSPVTWRPMRK